MGRQTNTYEMRREQVEANLGRLGNALVFLHLVVDRVQAAALVSGRDALLLPAVEDCRRAERLIREVQADIHASLQSGSEIQ